MTVLAVADTHTIVWYIFADPRLSPNARAKIDSAVASGDQVALSSISLAEMVYLVEKGRIDAIVFDGVLAALDEPDPLLQEVGCDRAVIQSMRRIPRGEVPDLPDRIVAATALHLGVPLISRDRKILASRVTTIW